MIAWAATFLVLALISAILGFSGIASVAIQIAWILFLIGLVLGALSVLLRRRGSMYW